VNAEEVIADLLSRGHSVRFRATGHSMHPLIRCDDYLLVEPASQIRRGDVVLTLADRGLTAHRVVSVSRGYVTTRGDNAPGDDDPVEATRVLGVVTHAERDGRMRRVRRESGFWLDVRRFYRRVINRLSA
jgi:signal peptidase I